MSGDRATGADLFLTVEEAATMLRIGRSSAYEQCRLYLHTGGEDGIPCIRIGRTIRVPRNSVDALARTDQA